SPARPPGRVRLGSRARPADTPLRVFPVGAAPPGRKRSPSRPPSQPQSHPGRVLLRFRACPGQHAAMGIPCRSTAPVRNGAQPEHQASPNRTRGGCSYGSEHAPADTPLRVFHVGAPPPVRKRTPARTPSQPQSHPGRVLLRFRACPRRHAATGISCRSTAPGAKTEPSQNPEPAPNRTRGGCSYGSEHAPADTPLRAFHVGAPPPVRSGAQSEPRVTPQSHPGRVLLRFRVRPGQHAAMGISCRSTAPVRKRSQARTPSYPQSHPGRVLLQPVTPGGDPAQSTIAAAQPKAISGRL